MLKILLDKDAKDAIGSSPAADTGAKTGVEEQQQTSTEVKEPSTPKTIAEHKEGLEDIKASIAAKYKDKQAEDKKDEQIPTDEKKEEEVKQEEKVEKKEEKKDDTTTPKLSDDDAKLPFHNHPRFKQLISERADFERRLTESETARLAATPDAIRMRGIDKFCVDNKISGQDFDESVRIAALVQSNPKAASAKLRELADAIDINQGTRLPTDLQTQVDDGKLSFTHAQEIASLRLKSASSQRQSEVSARSAQQQAQQQLQSSLNNWTQTKMSTDPSYKPKADAKSEDGKYEMVTDKFLALWSQSPPKTVDEAIQLAERAYQSVHRLLEAAAPKPPVRRPLTPRTTPSKEETEPVDIRKSGWAREVVRKHFQPSAS